MAIFRKSGMIRLMAVLLVISLTVPCYASAAAVEPVQPLASNYLRWYDVGIRTMGDGKLEVWFEVTATNVMDEVGAMSIRLYESSDQTTWKRVMTRLYEDYPSMMGSDDYEYSSYMPYQGVAGKYYKAYVKLWAGNDGEGDYVFVWTPIERAT